MRETQRKGDLAVSVALKVFTEMGYDVSVPFTESAAYDLIVDLNSSLKRVQVKYSKSRHIALRRIHSNSNGYVVKTPKKNSYDWLFVYSPNGDCFLIKRTEKIFKNKNAITVLEKEKIRKG